MSLRHLVFTTAWILLVTATCGVADAHFIWVKIATSKTGELSADAYFAETPAPGSAYLLDKIVKTPLILRHVDADAKPLSMNKNVEGDAGSLRAAIATKDACSVEGDYIYGIYELQGQPTLLHYYAKSIHATGAADLKPLGRAGALALDIVPELSDGKVAITVLWQGKPQPAAEVMALIRGAPAIETKTNAQGQAVLGALSDIRGIRACVKEPARSGEHNGQKYSQTHHYATLTLDLPEDRPTPAATAASKGEDASDLLAKARQARAVWSHFPGFTADITAANEKQSVAGHVRVAADGTVELELPNFADTAWVRQHLTGVVQHRMPDGTLGDAAVYISEPAAHPLGRHIRLTEATMGSDYRINKDVVSQVNRTMGDRRFTINVLDVTRNAEGKYLPAVFTITTWNKDNGDLISSATVMHHWQRVGKFDLPAHAMEIESGKDSCRVRTVELSHYQLISEGPAEREAKAR